MNKTDEIKRVRNEKLAEKVIKGLESRHISGYYAADRAEALSKALELIPEGSSISWGGSMSVEQIGLAEALKNGNYECIDRDTARSPEERKEIMRKAFFADFFIGSTNAITEDGILVNLDGYGNRVAAYVFGPDKVLLIVGMNKIVRDLDAAMKRTRTEAAPLNAQRFEITTPCKKTGTCADCKSPDSICSHMLITRLSMVPGRFHVILVNDDLGF